MPDGCSADIKIHSVHYLTNDSFDAMPMFVRFWIKAANMKKLLVLPINQFNAAGIQKEVPFLCFTERGARAAFDKEILTSLLTALEKNSVPRGYYFNENGAVTLQDGRVCFVRGGELIGECSFPYVISPSISKMHLLGSDVDLSILSSVLLASPPQVLLTFAYVILSSIRSVLVNSGIDFQAVLYVIGKQGLGKTTLAKRIAGIYEQDKKPVGIIQAGSTHAATNAIMTSLRDQPVVIDDLCLSASRSTERKRIELASNLIRQGTGDVPIIKKVGNSIENSTCAASLIMTAEFYLDNLSDLTRCILVPITNTLCIPDALTSSLVGGAVRHYSRWFTKQTDRKIEQLHGWLNTKLDISLDSRMSTNYACLGASFHSFITSLPGYNQSSYLADELVKKMAAAVDLAIAVHKDMIGKVNENRPVGNLSFCILEGYRHGAFKLAKKLKKLKKRSGIIWKNDLCLKSEALVQFVRQQPGYHDWTSNRITRALKDINALVLQEDSCNTVHLTKGTPRVYRIRLNVLGDTSEKY